VDRFSEFFSQLTDHPHPIPWQRDLAAESDCGNRLIRIPTGFGKTLGVLAAWAWSRVKHEDERWPRRLVWCLPMRVLVEQTQREVEKALGRVGLLWDGTSDHAGKVGTHLLMGGADSGDWHLYPEEHAVLIGTQDMLLSRSLNRGYAAPRARWPMEFGLLNQDCLWVMDEVQLMGVGLATSGQLQAFRNADRKASRELRPCFTWWMSATLQKAWVTKSPETAEFAQSVPATAIQAAGRLGPLWEGVVKPCTRIEVADAKGLARRVAELHLQEGRGRAGPTLVVLNTVDRAAQVFGELREDASLRGSDLRLVHSRFRPAERERWQAEFLNRGACGPGTDRIIVSTQVVEAGVDISAALLITELAPWASLVQRFGRCARWGGTARVVVVDLPAAVAQEAVQTAIAKAKKARSQGKSAKKVNRQEIADASETKAAMPYDPEPVRAARAALDLLPDVAPLHIDTFEEQHPELLSSLYPFEPKHFLMRHELEELFDTTPDLTGADIDISRFIRSGDERDLTVFWSEVPKDETPDSSLRPARRALCAVPFVKARKWLCGAEKTFRLKAGTRAWVWSWLDGEWKWADGQDLYPGQTVLVDRACGGYLETRGWAPDSDTPVIPVAPPELEPDEMADSAQDDETLSQTKRWQTIATHGRQVGRLARRLAPADLATLFDLAGRWHDAGKVHPAFNGSILGPNRPARLDLAKAPRDAWLKGKRLYPMPDGSRRPGFRHELASTLALFGVLERHEPTHPALLGPWEEWLQSRGADEPATKSGEPPSIIEQEVLALNAEQFDLLAYLVCAHHGKLRLAWHACPADQAAPDPRPRIRGVVDGETLPGLTLADSEGAYHFLPKTRLELAPAAAGLNPLTGASWTERVLGLLSRHGPFALAWMEALLRAADQRASRAPIADPLLKDDNGGHGLGSFDSKLAQPHPGGALSTSSGGDPQTRGPVDENGGGARVRGAGPGTTRPPDATRYIETTVGVLSYQTLAPLLAERVTAVELAIGHREYADIPLTEDLILAFHRSICADLVPEIAGRWRRKDVRVGAHEPPPAWQVPMLMRDYAADLATRISHADALSEDGLLDILAYAEGRMLHIHPFEDFNGRVTRLFLLEILYRLNLPIVTLAMQPGPDSDRYFAALRAFDGRDPRPLTTIWRERLENGD